MQNRPGRDRGLATAIGTFIETINTEETAYALEATCIDVGKYSFHIFNVDEEGVVVSRKVSRAKLMDTVDRLDPEIIAMEACSSAHHWGRFVQAAGRTVRLINAFFVKPFVRGSKNDVTDAQAIFEAADPPTCDLF
jgi:transposase